MPEEKKQNFPTDEELQAMYGDLLKDREIRDLSCWTESNMDGPCDDAAYVQTAEKDAEVMENLYHKALEGIKG